MRLLSVSRAQDSYEGQNVEGFRIETGTAIDESCSEEKFDIDAKVIVDAMWDCLPGGTLDRVLVHMLQRRLSSLIVSHASLDVAAREADTIPPEASSD